MFNLETFNDLFSRPLLQEDTLIQTKKGIGGQKPTFVKAERGSGGASGRWTSPSTDVFDLPELDIFTKEPLRGALKRSKFEGGGSSARQLQYVAMGLLLSQFEFIDTVTARDRMGQTRKENSKFIDETIKWTEDLFDEINKLDKDGRFSTVEGIKNLIQLNYDHLNTYINPSDLMRHTTSWDNLTSEDGLRVALTRFAASEVKDVHMGLGNLSPDPDNWGKFKFVGTPKKVKSEVEAEDSYDDQYLKHLSPQQIKKGAEEAIESQDAERKRKLDLYKRYLGTSTLNDLGEDEDEDAEESGKKRRRAATPEEKLARRQARLAKLLEVSPEEKVEIEKMVNHDLPILLNFFRKAAQISESPMRWFSLQKSLNRLNGMIYGKQVGSRLGYEKEIGEKFRALSRPGGESPLSPDDPAEKLESNIIKAIRNVAHSGVKPEQISNWYANTAMDKFNKLHAYMVAKNRKTGEYPGGFTIKNVLKFLRDEKIPEAVRARHTLKTSFNITPDELTTENYPTFEKFVKDLYSKNKEFASAYKAVLNPRYRENVGYVKTDDGKWEYDISREYYGRSKGEWGDVAELRDTLENKAEKFLKKIGRIDKKFANFACISYMQQMFDKNQIPLGAALHYTGNIAESEIIMPLDYKEAVKRGIYKAEKDPNIIKVISVADAKLINLAPSTTIIFDFSLGLKSELTEFIKAISTFDTQKIEELTDKYWNNTDPNNLELQQLRRKFIAKLADPDYRKWVARKLSDSRIQKWSRVKSTAINNLGGQKALQSSEGGSLEEKIKSIVDGIASEESKKRSAYKAELEEFYNAIDLKKNVAPDDFSDKEKEKDVQETEDENEPGHIEYFIPYLGKNEAILLTRYFNENYLNNYIEKYNDDTLSCTCAILKYDIKEGAPYTDGALFTFTFEQGGPIDSIEDPSEIIDDISDDLDNALVELADEEDNTKIAYVLYEVGSEVMFTSALFHKLEWDENNYEGPNKHDNRFMYYMRQIWPTKDETAPIRKDTDEDCEDVDLALDAFRFDEDGQKIKQSKQKVVFVPNNKKYKRQYLQDAWRHEAYWKNNH